MSNCKIIYWPLSQTCIGCQHGRLVDTEEPATYLCLINSEPNNTSGDCKEHTEKKSDLKMIKIKKECNENCLYFRRGLCDERHEKNCLKEIVSDTELSKAEINGIRQKEYTEKKEKHIWICPLCSNKQDTCGRCAVCGD